MFFPSVWYPPLFRGVRGAWVCSWRAKANCVSSPRSGTVGLLVKSSDELRSSPRSGTVGLLVESSDELCSSPRSGTLSAERGPGLLLPEVASRPLSQLRVWGPQPLLRARRLDGGTGSGALSERRLYSGCWVIGGCGCLEGPCSPWGRDGPFMLRSPIYPYMPCLVCLVSWPTTRASPPVRHLARREAHG